MCTVLSLLHFVEDEVLVYPLRIWKDAEAVAETWKRVLYIARHHVNAGLHLEKFWGCMQVSCAVRARHLFRSPSGQVVAELHMEDLRSSGPLAMLREVQKIAESWLQSNILHSFQLVKT